MISELSGTFGLESDIKVLLDKFIRDVPTELIAPKPDTPEYRIFKAAREVFAEKGFEATRTRDIANKASVNLAMIHYYFRSKSLLYRRLLSAEIHGVFLQMAKAWRQVDSIQEIVLLLPIKLTSLFREDPIRASLIRHEIGNGGIILSQVIEDMDTFGPKGFKTLLMASFESGKKFGRFKKVDFEYFAAYLLSLTYGMVLLMPVVEKVLGKDFRGDDEIWEQLMNTISILMKDGVEVGGSDE